MLQKLVTIIVVSYNNFNYYRECLESILNQDYENIELIFSDDCSENFVKEEIEKYINDNKRNNIVNFIVNSNETNLGTVKHLNKVIKISNGEYIKVLAVDDTLYEVNTISKLTRYLEKKSALMCVGYVDVYDKNMKEKIGEKPSKEEVDIIKRSNALEMHKIICISGGFLPAPSRFYSREFFERYGLYDEDYTLLEDKATIAKAIREGCKIHFIDEVITKYRSGGISSAGNINPYLKKDRETFNKKEVFPYWGVSLINKRKNYVIWGTSTKYFDNREKLLQASFKYLVDSDASKQGRKMDGKLIYSPEKLLEENKDNLMVIICSAFYIEISKWLESNGFRENVNFISINFIKEL